MKYYKQARDMIYMFDGNDRITPMRMISDETFTDQIIEGNPIEGIFYRGCIFMNTFFIDPKKAFMFYECVFDTCTFDRSFLQSSTFKACGFFKMKQASKKSIKKELAKM